MWNQAIQASSNVTITSAPGVAPTPPKSVRERLTVVREALLKCHAVSEHIYQVVDPTPQKDTPGAASGPMGLEAIATDLEVLTNALADRLQYLAVRIGG